MIRKEGPRVEVIVERCAALDVHKETVMACVRRPGDGSRRQQEVREFRTWASSLRVLRAWLAEQRVTQVAMEANGVYWRRVWAELVLLDGPGLSLHLSEPIRGRLRAMEAALARIDDHDRIVFRDRLFVGE